MTGDRDFVVSETSDLSVSDILRTLSAGYGRDFSEDWFAWKHREGPWGPSRCVVARDDVGLLGVGFALPWRLEVGQTSVEGARLVDGTTAPRAVRRGVFRAVVATLRDMWDPISHPGIAIATATPPARDSHVKNGAVALEAIGLSYCAVRPSLARVESGTSALEGYRRDSSAGRFATEWSPDSLRWRLDPRSGCEYQVSRLVESDSAHGVVHRTATSRGLRSLVITTQWGPKRDREQLIRSLARRSRAVAVLAPMGPGTPAPPRRMALSRGGSLLCIWDRTGIDAGLPTSPTIRSSWSLDGLALEGVI